MTDTQNLKNWVAIFEKRDEVKKQIKAFLDQNLDERFIYEIETNNGDAEDDFLDDYSYDLLTDLDLCIYDKDNPKNSFKKSFSLKNKNNYPNTLIYEDSCVCIDEISRNVIIKNYNNFLTKITSLDLNKITKQLLQNTNNNLKFLEGTILFTNNHKLIFYETDFNEAEMILKDNVLYCIKNNNQKLDTTNLNELNKIVLDDFYDVSILPYDYYSYRIEYGNNYNQIEINPSKKTLSIKLPTTNYLLDTKGLAKSTYNKNVIDFYRKDVNLKNADIMQQVNKRSSSITKTYDNLDINAFLDILNISNWYKSLTIKGYMLFNDAKITHNVFLNSSYDSYDANIKNFIDDYINLYKVAYDEIDYKDVLNSIDRKKLATAVNKINAYNNSLEDTVVVKLKQTPTIKNKIRR